MANWSRGVVGRIVRVSWNQVHGFTPNAAHVAVKLASVARVRPPRSLPKNNQFLRPMANGFTARSAALLSIARSPSRT